MISEQTPERNASQIKKRKTADVLRPTIFKKKNRTRQAARKTIRSVFNLARENIYNNFSFFEGAESFWYITELDNYLSFSLEKKKKRKTM